MPSPFPGMDPWLENPQLWPDVHHELVSQIRSALNPALRPQYVARVELRVYISDEDDTGREVLVPDGHVEVFRDNEIEEARVEVRHVASNALVTVIEVLSPANKVRGARGRTSFMDKRQEILNAEVNWVELDLLRAGLPSVTRPPLKASDYRLLVSRAGHHLRSSYWPVSVRQPLPTIGIPLRGKDPDVPLALGAVLGSAYDHAAYDLSIDYRQPPIPPLEGEDAAWADGLLRQRGLR